MTASGSFSGNTFGGHGTATAVPSAPTPTVIATNVGSLFASVPACEIAFSDDLRGPWEIQPHCYLDRLRITAAPEIDQASATWYYGSVMQPGASAFETELPLNVAGKFVRITINNESDAGSASLGDWDADANSPSLTSGSGQEDSFYTVSVSGNTELDGVNDWQVGDVLVFRNGAWFRLTHIQWFGIVATETLHPDGKANDISSGRQVLTCYGLLYLAEREQITSSTIETKDGAATGDFITINRGLSFNQDQRGEFSEHGNRSEEEMPTGATDIGAWDAEANTPSLSDGSGSADGEYYTISKAGNTLLDGNSDWSLDDIVVFRNGKWKRGSTLPVSIFSYGERGQSEWNAEQAVEYILNRNNPWPLKAVIDISSGNLDWLPKGGVDTDRRTVKAVLDDLIQRQRGVGYFVRFNHRTEQIELVVFSFVDVSINMPNGTTLEANPNQYSLDFESALDVSSSELNNTITTKYHKVVVEGDWRTSTCTLSLNPDADQLVKDWTATEQQAYFDGASRASWYTAINPEKKVEANNTARNADKLAHVFARFKISDDWDLLATDIDDTTITERVFGRIDTWNANGEFEDEDIETWISGLTIVDHLPLRERYDYSADHIEDKDWKDTVTITDSELPPFRKPFSFIQTNVPRALSWELLDKIEGDAEAAPDKRKWSVTTRPHHDRAAVTLNVSGGKQQFLASDTWTTKGFTDKGNWNAAFNTPTLSDGSGVEGDYYTVTTDSALRSLDGVTDWKIGDRLFFTEGTWRRAPSVTDDASYPLKNHPLNYSGAWVTLTFEMPERATIERRMSLPLDGEQERALVISVRDCRLDYVLPNTVVGIKDGALQKSVSGGFVRDDRERLETFAKAAAEWYAVQRQTLELSYKQVREIVKLGWLIADVGPSYQNGSVRSVVTSITYDILAKSTSFQTSFAELDLT